MGIRLVLVATAVLLSAGTASASEPRELVVTDTKVHVGVQPYDGADRLDIDVREPVALKGAGLLKMMGFTYQLEPGRYTPSRKTIQHGREYALVPVRQFMGGRPNSAGAASFSTGCYAQPEPYIAVDIQSEAVLDRVVHRTETCEGHRIMWDWAYRVSLAAAGDLHVLPPNERNERIIAEDRVRTEQVEQSLKARAIANEATRSAKSEIGARVCRTDRGITYIGFTEARSPDNGKIQIRIVDARASGSEGLRLGGFDSSIVWAVPDDWDLCN